MCGDCRLLLYETKILPFAEICSSFFRMWSYDDLCARRREFLERFDGLLARFRDRRRLLSRTRPRISEQSPEGF